MPELAEVEYYRKCWDCGRGQVIQRVHLHAEKRLFRGINAGQLQQALTGAVFTRSEARGKQLLFVFSADVWVGLHLGMTGQLRIEPPAFQPGRHDHFVLIQRDRSLVFRDPRLFGRVRFACQPTPPDWWRKLPPPVDSREFTPARMAAFLQRHRRLAIKPALFLQSGFPGVGNWMADEILWRARIHPRTAAGRLSHEQVKRLWRSLRFVCRAALKHISPAFSDPPRGWLFHERWEDGGCCPIHGAGLRRETVGGRTTAWCPRCQRRWSGPRRGPESRLSFDIPTRGD
jgi:formamidopyrimidine-DNA glycosylase